jgi:hypothetical protein
MEWPRPWRAALAAGFLLFIAYFAAVVLLQWRGNAFHSELGNTADEPAHYVTGLMVRDYIGQSLMGKSVGSPIAFARNYYVHYPKVALGHWPPAFYLLQAVWTLLFTPSVISVMLLMAAITAALATAVYHALGSATSRGVAIGAGLLFISIPTTEQFSQLVMAEILVALLVFLAVLAYGRYLETEGWQPAAWFGLWFSLALLTKGTGIQLALVPPLALLFTGRWYLLRRFSFWLPVIIVCVLAAPWYLWIPGAQHESVARFGGLQVATNRQWRTPMAWAEMLGPVALVMACVGLVLCVRQSHRALRNRASQNRSGLWIAAIASLLRDRKSVV